MRNYHYAKAAYEAYCASTGGVSLISGEKLPEFDRLKDDIQDAWWAAAQSVRRASGLDCPPEERG